MRAQRLCLEAAAALVADRPGPIIDLGIGAGRTFDHLAALFPDRAVFAFDNFVHSAIDVLPPPERMVMGDIRDTLPRAADRLGAPAALIHNDLGSADATGNAAVAAWLAPAIMAIARADAVVVTSFRLPLVARDHPLPGGVRPGRYHIMERVPGN